MRLVPLESAAGDYGLSLSPRVYPVNFQIARTRMHPPRCLSAAVRVLRTRQGDQPATNDVQFRELPGSSESSVVIRVAIRLKIRANLDGRGPPAGRIELKTAITDTVEWFTGRFGTVRPRVQIPGPRPNFELKSPSDSTALVIARLSSVVVV